MIAIEGRSQTRNPPIEGIHGSPAARGAGVSPETRRKGVESALKRQPFAKQPVWKSSSNDDQSFK
jgi:hypothetical protein